MTACGAGEPAEAGWAVSIDTLANGAVVVRSPSIGVWGSAGAWRIEEDLRIGTAMGDGPELFGDLTDFAVDDHGRIWALDRQANEVRVFDAEGGHIRTVGHQGGGPGEFDGPIGLARGPEGRLWVADPSNARYSVFDTTGEFITSHRRPIAGTIQPWPGGMDSDGRMYDYGFTRDGRILVRFDPAMQSADTFRVPTYDGPSYTLRNPQGRMLMSMPVPFSPRLERHVDAQGLLWSGVSDRYRIVRTTLTGDTVRVVERDYEPVPVTSEDRDSAMARLDWLREANREPDASRIPEVKQAYRSFFTDDRGYLWVRPSTPIPEQGRVLDVFDPDGRYLGRVPLDFRLDPDVDPMIIGDRLYTTVRDELDVRYIVRARIVGRDVETRR